MAGGAKPSGQVLTIAWGRGFLPSPSRHPSTSVRDGSVLPSFCAVVLPQMGWSHHSQTTVMCGDGEVSLVIYVHTLLQGRGQCAGVPILTIQVLYRT